VGLKMIWATKDKAEAHYADLSKRPFFPALVAYFTKGPIVGMVWEGPEVIKTGRKWTFLPDWVPSSVLRDRTRSPRACCA
jgi:nucleoside diphosphate kinase